MSFPHHSLYFAFFSNALSYSNASVSSYLVVLQSTSIFLNCPLSSRRKFTVLPTAPWDSYRHLRFNTLETKCIFPAITSSNSIITQRTNLAASSLTSHVPSLTLLCQVYVLRVLQVFPIPGAHPHASTVAPVRDSQFLPEIWWPPPTASLTPCHFHMRLPLSHLCF